MLIMEPGTFSGASVPARRTEIAFSARNSHPPVRQQLSRTGIVRTNSSCQSSNRCQLSYCFTIKPPQRWPHPRSEFSADWHVACAPPRGPSPSRPFSSSRQPQRHRNSRLPPRLARPQLPKLTKHLIERRFGPEARNRVPVP